MRTVGLKSVSPWQNTNKPAIGHKICPYLLRHLEINRPNQAWCADRTYIRLASSFAHLVAVIDWYSRKVSSWALPASMDESFCVDALERVLRLRPKPEIFNSDQSSRFTGRAMNNITVKRLWHSVKYEEVYLKEYADVEERRKSLSKYLYFFNNECLYRTLDG